MPVFKNKMVFKWAKSEDLSDSALRKAADEIDQGLVDGHLGGYLIKKRVPRKGNGKRNSYRTIVAFRKEHRTIFIYGFAKNQRDNINTQEREALKKLADGLLSASETKIEEMIKSGNLYEVIDEKNQKK